MKDIRRPLVPVAFAFAAGLLVADVPVALAALALAAVCALLGRSRGGTWGARFLLAAAVCAAAAGGAFRAAGGFDRLPADHFSFAVPSDRAVFVRATLAEDPRPSAPRGGARPGRGISWIARGRMEAAGDRAVSGEVRFFLPQGFPARAGDIVEGVARIAYSAPLGNPGEWDRAAHDRRAGVIASVSFDADDAVVHPTASSPGIVRLRRRARAALEGALPPETARFLLALLLGVRSELDPELRVQFQESGTLHFLAVSGLHLVFLLAPAALLLKTVVGDPRLRAAMLIALALGYGALVGFRPSVARACVLAVAFLAGDLVRRPRDFASAMALAAIAILAAQPQQLFLPGFQLSFAACLGLVYLSGPIAGLFRKEEPLAEEVPERGDPPPLWKSAARAVGGWCERGAVLSAAAWLATAPIVLFHFSLATPVAILGNLLLAPWIVCALLGGFAFLGLSTVWPALAGAFVLPLSLSIAVVERIAACLAGLPGGHFYLPSPGLPWIIAYGACLVGWGIRPRAPACVVLRNGIFVGTADRRWGAAVAACALAWTVSLVATVPRAGFAVLDVRQGLCSFLVTDDGKTVVYDCGAYGGSDPTPSVVAPALASRGVRRIDALVLSHPHDDHASGVAGLLKRFSVSGVFVGLGFSGSAEGERILAPLREAGVPVLELRRFDRLPLGSNSWELRVLHPGAEGARFPNPNDRSLVILAERKIPPRRARVEAFRSGRPLALPDGPLRILWTGDIEEPATETLLAESEVRCEMFVIPHHGSAMRRTEELARAAAPAAAVNSARRGFASPAVLDAYRAAGAVLFETWRDGAVFIEWE